MVEKEIDTGAIRLVDGRFSITCLGCGREVHYSARAGAYSALSRKTCRHCRVDYRSRSLAPDSVYKNEAGKWCSTCPSCGAEQAYTRMDHAKTSHSSGWRCKPCSARDMSTSAAATGFVGSIRAGWLRRFEMSAKQRGLSWELSEDLVNKLWALQDGRCALSGAPLSTQYRNETASIDRIDSGGAYVYSNVQIVHKSLNMMKRNMADEDFIEWCRRVAAHADRDKK